MEIYEIDSKLLQDLAPYSNAYGHLMSNLIYNYKQYVACYLILKTPDTKIVAEWYERVLRSFLITKNITSSKSLVSKDMGFKEKDLPFLSKEEYWKIYEDCKLIINSFKYDVESVKYKSDLRILAESYEYYNPDSPLIKAMFKICDKDVKSMVAELEFSDKLLF